MKKLLFLAAFALIAHVGFSQVTAAANPAAAKADLALPVFETQTFDFGKIKQNVPATHEFTFTNNGKVPMVITNAHPSCGCTIPDWSKDPIPPGGQGFVKATYSAAGLSAFDKTVTVTANVEGGTILLRIKGEVVANQ